MKSLITTRRLIAATVAAILLAAVFLAGVHHGYNRGFTEGEHKTNGWWIDKKARYYESGEIRRKRIHLKHHHV
jgi:hypothetical protein